MVLRKEENQTRKHLRKIFNTINFSEKNYIMNIFGNLEDFQTSRRGNQSSVPKVSHCCYRQSHNTQGQEL
jgi:hypothetical protein